jgi:HAD superfamily hydrolase (TIGR01549 family)
MREHIAGVLFDLDGTLVDTAEMTATTIIETLAGFGCRVTVEQVRANGGRPLRGWFSDELSLPADIADAAYWRYVDTITERAGLSVPLSGAFELLVQLKSHGIPIAVVTNRLTRIALPIISAAGWEQLIDAVVGQETAPRTKPAPDPAQHALAAIGVSAGNAAYIGDTEADMACAAAAGIAIRIGLAGETSADLLSAAGATHIARSLEAAAAALLPALC